MLTLMFRYFRGSFVIAAINVRRSVTAPFMFSYNCLSFSNCPAVPSPSFRRDHQSVHALGRRN